MEWTGFVYGDDFKEIINQGLKLLAEKKGRKWLTELFWLHLPYNSGLILKKTPAKCWFFFCVFSGIRTATPVKVR
jgi:hypothetical protein